MPQYLKKPLHRSPGSIGFVLGTKVRTGAAFVRERWWLVCAGLAMLGWVAGRGPTPSEDWEVFVASLVPPLLAGIYLGASRVKHPFRWAFALLLLPLANPFMPSVVPLAFDIGAIVASGQGGEVYVSPREWALAANVSFTRTILWLPIVMLGVWAGVGECEEA